MFKKKKVKEEKKNQVIEIFFKHPPSNFPGVDMSKIIRVYPIGIREDGYVLPTEPMTRRRWWFLYYISFIIPIRRFSRKNNPFYPNAKDQTKT